MAQPRQLEREALVGVKNGYEPDGGLKQHEEQKELTQKERYIAAIENSGLTIVSEESSNEIMPTNSDKTTISILVTCRFNREALENFRRTEECEGTLITTDTRPDGLVTLKKTLIQ